MVCERVDAVRPQRKPDLRAPRLARQLERQLGQIFGVGVRTIDELRAGGCDARRAVVAGGVEGALKRGLSASDEERAYAVWQLQRFVGVERNRIGHR